MWRGRKRIGSIRGEEEEEQRKEVRRCNEKRREGSGRFGAWGRAGKNDKEDGDE